MPALAIVALCVTYAAMGLGVARIAAGHWAHAMALNGWKRERERYRNRTPAEPPEVPSGDQWLGAIMMGACLGVVWPAGLLLLVRLPAVGAEREARQRAELKRLRQMERDLLDGPHA